MTEESTAPTNNISVSLDTTVTPHALKVNDNGGQNIIRQKNSPQRIKWNLTGPLAQGAFVPMDEARPGFEWLSVPPPGRDVFSEAKIGSSGNSLDLTDMHESAASNGAWPYLLRVRYQGEIYETGLLIDGTVGIMDDEPCDAGDRPPAFARVLLRNNPIIINR